MEEKKKPNRPISVIYADAKQAITRQVGNTMAAYGLPIFMAERKQVIWSKSHGELRFRKSSRMRF